MIVGSTNTPTKTAVFSAIIYKVFRTVGVLTHTLEVCICLTTVTRPHTHTTHPVPSRSLSRLNLDPVRSETTTETMIHTLEPDQDSIKGVDLFVPPPNVIDVLKKFEIQNY